MNHWFHFTHYNVLIRAVDCNQMSMISLYRSLLWNLTIDKHTIMYDTHFYSHVQINVQINGVISSTKLLKGP